MSKQQSEPEALTLTTQSQTRQTTQRMAVVEPQETIPLLKSRSRRKSPPIVLATDRDLWERQLEENDRAWGCFVLYRDLHPSIRSMAKAFIAYIAMEKGEDPDFDSSLVMKAPTWFERQSAKYLWRQRAREFDTWKDEDTLRRLQSTKVRFLVETASVGRTMRNKAQLALNALQPVMQEVIMHEDGTTTTIEVPALNPAAITQLAKAGTDMERQSLGLPKEPNEQSRQALGIQVNIANVLPNPEPDAALLARVMEISEATQRSANQAHPGGLPETVTDRTGRQRVVTQLDPSTPQQQITIEAIVMPSTPAAAKPKPKPVSTKGASGRPRPGELGEKAERGAS